MALLGDQPGDRGGLGRHLEGAAKGLGERRQLGRWQGVYALVKRADRGGIQLCIGGWGELSRWRPC